MLKFKNLVYLITLYSATLYFSLITVFGRNGFSVEVSTDDYIGIIAGVDALTMMFCFWGIAKLKEKTASSVFMMVVPVVISFLYFAEGATSKIMVKSFLAFSLPCVYVAVDVAGRQSIRYFSKWLEVIMLIITMAVIIILPSVIFARELTFEYQSYSYYAGFAFCINYFFLMFRDKFDRFSIFKSKTYFFFSIPLLLVQAAASLISGGRGGFLLIMSSLVIFTLLSLRYSARRKWLLALVVLFAGLGLFISIIPSTFSDAMSQGSARTFSYISGGHIDLTQTSGRDNVYEQAISLIKEQPLLGYGFFDYFRHLRYYPHNIFLEVLLQGGFLYLIVFVLFLLFVIRKMIKIIKRDDDNLLLLAMTLWPTVELLFSASYVMFGMFWFIVTYVVCYNSKKIRIAKHTLK